MDAPPPSSDTPGIRPTAPSKQVLQPGVRRREALSWAMYDFANSGYTTVVITAVFSAYFVAGIAGGAPWATFAWTAALSVSYAIVLLTAPWLGAWADAHAGKKRLLAVCTVGCVVATAALAGAGPGAIALALGLLILSNTFYGAGENVVAAFLPELGSADRLGTLSGWGWALGYLGGLVSLGACLAYITWAQGQGATAPDFIPGTLLITAALYALAALPFFLLVRERTRPTGPRVGSAWRQVAETWRQAERFRDMRRFMVCIVFFQAGIQTVIALAAIYAQEAMGFETAQTIQLIFLVNITAALGAFAFGYWQDRIGPVRGIAVTLVGWMAMIGVAWSTTTVEGFWVAANLAGLCLGASQSAARALVGVLSPEAQRAEFFGLWGLAVKLSSILGPLTYGAVTWATQGDHRTAMLVTGGYFAIGLVLLTGVDAQRGQQAARAGASTAA